MKESCCTLKAAFARRDWQDDVLPKLGGPCDSGPTCWISCKAVDNHCTTIDWLPLCVHLIFVELYLKWIWAISFVNWLLRAEGAHFVKASLQLTLVVRNM